jgi:ATP-dependent DNA helicase RecQ
LKTFASPFEEQEKTFHIKELNEEAEEKGCEDVSTNKSKPSSTFGHQKLDQKRQKFRIIQKIMLCAFSSSQRNLKEKWRNDMSWQSSLLNFFMRKAT